MEAFRGFLSGPALRNLDLAEQEVSPSTLANAAVGSLTAELVENTQASTSSSNATADTAAKAKVRDNEMVTGDSASAQVRSNLNLDPFAVDRIMASLDDFSPLRRHYK